MAAIPRDQQCDYDLGCSHRILKDKEKERKQKREGRKDGGDGDRRWKDERILVRNHPMGHEEH